MSTKSLRYDDVQVGDEIPMLEIPLTRTLIVSTAIASRDYQDVHHDPALANDKGSQDIFMNILTTNGLVGRYITDWAGPNAVLQSVKIRLGAPNYPGDTMRLTGSVTAKADGVIEVGLRGANGLGDHVTGTVALVLPDPPIVWRADLARGGSADEKAAKKAEKQAKKKAKADKKKSKKSKKGATK
jgi:acyl dehydratase